MQDIPLGYIVNNLLKSVIYKENDERLWQALLTQQNKVHDYVVVMDLQLIIDEAEGYSFLRHRETLDEEATIIPKLISARPLSYIMSVLCLLLRKCLVERDAIGATDLAIISHQQLLNLAEVYTKSKNNEAKMIDQLEINIKRLIDYGLLRPLKHTPQVYEIRRIVKALINADWLANLNEKLQEYAQYAERAAEL